MYKQKTSEKTRMLVREDSAIWDEFRAGNAEAFTFIYNSFVNPLYNYGKKFAVERELLKDLLHEFFVDLWKRKENLSATNSIKNYLYKSFRHKIVREMSRQKSSLNTTLFENYDFEIELSPEQNLIDVQKYKMRAESLNSALKSLTKRQREAVFLKYYDKLTNAEIAVIMGLNEQSVYNLISDSLKALKKKITPGLLVITLLILSILKNFQ